MKRTAISVLISIAAVAMAAVHLFVYPLDNIALIFLLVACLPWLLTIVKTIELPGGTKIELQDFKKIEEKAEAQGIILVERTSPLTLAYMMAADDPNVALAGLRIEIEKRLRALASSCGAPERAGVGQLLEILKSESILSPGEISLFADLIPTLNSAVHAQEITPAAFEWAKRVGPKLIELLDRHIDKRKVA